jgi:hypothetical protein
MAFWRLSLVVTLSLVGGASWPLDQTASESARRTLAGTWSPSDPARTEAFFDVGIGWIPGDGRLVIEQTPNRLTVTRSIPDAKLDRLLDSQRREFIATVIYWIDAPARGGAGANGMNGSSWRGDQLILTQKQSGGRRITEALALDGDRLRLDIQITAENKDTTRSEWFNRVPGQTRSN